MFVVFKYSSRIAGVLGISLLGLTLSAQEDLTNAPNAGSQFSPARVARGDLEGTGKFRVREGTSIADRGGFFRLDGEGATFISESRHEFGALPNLNLERIVRTLKNSDEAESIGWSVSGVVTEFNGRNYLLINRAVYKSAVPPPTPEQVLN